MLRYWISVSIILLNGCQLYGGLGHDFNRGTDMWNNPVGIVGARQPLGKHFELDYRHVSNMGGSDEGAVNSVSILVKVGRP